MNLGNITIAALWLGGVQAKSAYIGSEQVWSGEEPGPTVEPLCFTAEEANSILHLDKISNPDAISLETSTDGSTWTDYAWSNKTGDTLTLANVGDKVYMRAKGENSTISKNYNNYYRFSMTGKIAASGNIQTLLNANGSRTDIPNACYAFMFSGCSSLTTAPALPATTLADYSYNGMFDSCTSLTQAPVISAMTLGQWSCLSMFRGCTSMRNVVLPATTLSAIASYSYMFYNCSSLSSIEVGLSAWPSDNTKTENWVQGVAASGTFTCPAALPDERGNNRIPSGWTKVDAA